MENVAFGEQVIDAGQLRRGHSQECGLHIHALVELQVVAMHQHWRAGIAVKLAEAANMVDVRVSADDGLHVELVPPNEVENAVYFIAGIDDQRFARDGIPHDGAIALQNAHGNGDVNQFLRGGVLRGARFAHRLEYIIRKVWFMTRLGEALGHSLLD